MQLENKADADRCEVKQYPYYWDNNMTILCGSYSKYMYAPIH